MQELDDLERGIETAPGDEEIGQVVEQFKAAAGRFSALQTEAKNMDDAIAALEAEREQCRNKLEKLFEGEVEKEFDREDRVRIVQLAARTRRRCRRSCGGRPSGRSTGCLP